MEAGRRNQGSSQGGVEMKSHGMKDAVRDWMWGVTGEMGFHGHGPEKRLEIQDQVFRRSNVWLGPISVFMDCCLLVPSHGRRSEGALWDLYHEGTNLVRESSSLMT